MKFNYSPSATAIRINSSIHSSIESDEDIGIGKEKKEKKKSWKITEIVFYLFKKKIKDSGFLTYDSPQFVNEKANAQGKIIAPRKLENLLNNEDIDEQDEYMEKPSEQPTQQIGKTVKRSRIATYKGLNNNTKLKRNKTEQNEPASRTAAEKFFKLIVVGDQVKMLIEK